MTPEGLDLPGSASPIEYMHDAPLEASGLHPTVNMMAKRAGMTPADYWASSTQPEAEQGHGIEDEPLDQAERDAEHTAQRAGQMSPPGPSGAQPPGQGQTYSAPRLAPNLGPHPMERFAANGRWLTRDELGGAS